MFSEPWPPNPTLTTGVLAVPAEKFQVPLPCELSPRYTSPPTSPGAAASVALRTETIWPPVWLTVPLLVNVLLLTAPMVMFPLPVLLITPPLRFSVPFERSRPTASQLFTLNVPPVMPMVAAENVLPLPTQNSLV